MAFSDAEKVEIRRHCGYPLKGGAASAMQNYRFFQSYGTLEYRLNNMSAEEEAVVRSPHLDNLAELELAIAGASDNLDTAKASVWEWNRHEVKDRTALYDQWRRKLCGFLGVPPGPALGDANTVRIVV